MRPLMIKAGVLTFSLMFVMHACRSKKTAETSVPPTPPVAQAKPKSVCDTIPVSYNSHIKTIMDAHCTNCHNAQKRAAGIDLSTYESVKYEATGARFMGSMRHQVYYSPMPKNKFKLADSTLQMISCWIEKGLPL